jgi:hypothetical protein
MSERRIPYDPPLRSDVLCRYCHQEIAAAARIIGSLELAGVHEYEWRHVATDSPTCIETRVASPYDAWAATRKLRAVEEQP